MKYLADEELLEVFTDSQSARLPLSIFTTTMKGISMLQSRRTRRVGEFEANTANQHEKVTV